MDLKELYRDVILDHNRSPRNFGRLEPADATAVGHNPLCGDQLDVTLRLDGRPAGGPALRRPGLRHLDRLGLADERSGQGPQRRQEIEQLYQQVHALLTGRSRAARPTSASLRAGGRRRIPRAGQVRQPLLAHAECRARATRTRAGDRRSNSMRAYENEPVIIQRDVEAIMVPSGPADHAQARPGRLHHPGARRQLYALCRRQPVPPGRRAGRRHRQGSRTPAGTAPECHRGGRARTGLGADAQLLRSGNPDQHRRSRTGLRVRGRRRTPIRRATFASR